MEYGSDVFTMCQLSSVTAINGDSINIIATVYRQKHPGPIDVESISRSLFLYYFIINFIAVRSMHGKTKACVPLAFHFTRVNSSEKHS